MEAGLCERVGCGEPQVCSLLIAPQETHAWLVSPGHVSADEGVALCDNHADRISVPFGWTLVDDRAKPTRKRRKKKTEPSPVAPSDAELPADEPAPTLPIEPSVDVEPERGPAAPDDSDDYVEPEYQFREDDAVATSIDTPVAAGTDVAAVDSPPGAPLDTDDAMAMGEESEPNLSMVPSDDNTEKADDLDDDGQGALWDSQDADDTEPDETTPLLQRAFRVVRDD
jgi:hypothetical protein